jgi:hypothetical protein
MEMTPGQVSEELELGGEADFRFSLGRKFSAQGIDIMEFEGAP